MSIYYYILGLSKLLPNAKVRENRNFKDIENSRAFILEL